MKNMKNVDAKQGPANTYTPERMIDLLRERRFVSNSKYIPALCSFSKRGKCDILFTDEEYDTSVNLLESLAFSSAACAALHDWGTPYLAPLNIHAKCRMADGAFWDRCALATVIYGKPNIKDICFVGFSDIRYLLDYARPNGILNLQKYTGIADRTSRVSDEFMVPVQCLTSVTVIGDDRAGTIDAETFNGSRVRIHYRTLEYPERLQMLLEEDALAEWEKWVDVLHEETFLNIPRCDALCLQGGGMLSLVAGAMAMWKLDRLGRLPTTISGVSGGAWATAVYFHYMKGKDAPETNLKSFIRDSVKRLHTTVGECVATSQLMERLNALLVSIGNDIGDFLAKHHFHWKQFSDNLIGENVTWRDMTGYTIYHPCCVLNDNAIITALEAAIGQEDKQESRKVLAKFQRDV